MLLRLTDMYDSPILVASEQIQKAHCAKYYNTEGEHTDGTAIVFSSGSIVVKESVECIFGLEQWLRDVRG